MKQFFQRMCLHLKSMGLLVLVPVVVLDFLYPALIFLAYRNVGFNEYLTDCRLRHAEYMIKNEPGRTIGEIAYACGFNDSNYFSYKFRERYGVPPTRFRSSIKRT